MPLLWRSCGVAERLLVLVEQMTSIQARLHYQAIGGLGRDSATARQPSANVATHQRPPGDSTDPSITYGAPRATVTHTHEAVDLLGDLRRRQHLFFSFLEIWIDRVRGPGPSSPRAPASPWTASPAKTSSSVTLSTASPKALSRLIDALDLPNIQRSILSR
jgi:hypothetical protein